MGWVPEIMSSRNDSFRHESLHDGKSIKALLKSIEKGLGDGEISLEDEDGRLVLTPEGLLRLKITASSEEDRQKLTIRISWSLEEEFEEKHLSIS